MNEIEPDNNTHGNRRSFVGRVFTSLGLWSLFVSLATSVYANFRFFFPKVLYEPPSRFKAGFLSDYQTGVSDRWAKSNQVWIVREGDELYALSRVCTHLGCLTGFFANEELFKCPCHGSNFSVEGDPVAGPAPVPLYRLALTRGKDGQLIVDKAQRENRPGERNKPPFVLKV